MTVDANESSTPPSGSSAELTAWIARSLLLGIDDSTIAASLVDHGIRAPAAYEEIASIRRDPVFTGTWRTTQTLRKLESLLAIRHSLAIANSRAGRVDRRARLSREQFLTQYYAANRPVVLTGLLEGSAALDRWTPDYLEEACGEAQVEVMSGRNADPLYEIRSEDHRTSMTLSEYTKCVVTSAASNDFYMVANNGFFDCPGTVVLREEVPPLPQYLNTSESVGKIFFWFGPAGTVTPLHHDVMNVLLAQIVGRKRFILISPDQTPWVYNNIGVYSEVDCEAPNFEKHPLFRKVLPATVDLQAGESLFIPVGWWHHVRAVDLSMTITYTNFVFPNDFHWSHPTAL
jgi:Cupin-like domain